MHEERAMTIAAYAHYRAHEALFDAASGWQREWLHPELRDAIAACEAAVRATPPTPPTPPPPAPTTDADARGRAPRAEDGASDPWAPLRAKLHKCAEGIYTFPMLTPAACAMLVDEIDGYGQSGLPTARPNSMNKYGLVLNEIGMEPLFDSLVCSRAFSRPLPPSAAVCRLPPSAASCRLLPPSLAFSRLLPPPAASCRLRSVCSPVPGGPPCL